MGDAGPTLPGCSTALRSWTRSVVPPLPSRRALNAERNQVSAEVAERKRKGEDATELMDQNASMKEEIERCTAEATAAGQQMQEVLSRFPICRRRVFQTEFCRRQC